MRSGVRVWGGTLLAVAVLGCDGNDRSAGPAADTRPGDAAATAGAIGDPDAPPGILLTDARIQLPVIAGRPGVAYLTVSQNGGPARSIAAVHVAGAGRSEIHETRDENGISRMAKVQDVPLGSGGAVRFAPGGTHIMLFDLDPALKAGGTSEVTVIFSDGDKASIAAPVTSAGAGRGEP